MKKLVCSALILSMLVANASVTGMAAEPVGSIEAGSIQETAGSAETELELEPETEDVQAELKENSWRYSDGELIIDQDLLRTLWMHGQK